MPKTGQPSFPSHDELVGEEINFHIRFPVLSADFDPTVLDLPAPFTSLCIVLPSSILLFVARHYPIFAARRPWGSTEKFGYVYPLRYSGTLNGVPHSAMCGLRLYDGCVRFRQTGQATFRRRPPRSRNNLLPPTAESNPNYRIPPYLHLPVLTPTMALKPVETGLPDIHRDGIAPRAYPTISRNTNPISKHLAGHSTYPAPCIPKNALLHTYLLLHLQHFAYLVKLHSPSAERTFKGTLGATFRRNVK